jgi:hypothetical protein
MRKHTRITATRLSPASALGRRKYFPAWVDAAEGTPVLPVAAVVLPRVRAALPLRRVHGGAGVKTADVKRPSSHARGVR